MSDTKTDSPNTEAQTRVIFPPVNEVYKNLKNPSFDGYPFTPRERTVASLCFREGVRQCYEFITNPQNHTEKQG